MSANVHPGDKGRPARFGPIFRLLAGLCVFLILLGIGATPVSAAGEVLTQSQFRWYANTNAVQPTTPLAAQDSAATLNSTATPARLRMNVGVTSSTLGAASQDFSLQYGTSTSGPWTDVGDSAGWWNASWGSRRKITFDNSASATNLTDFPVRISLTAVNIDYAKTQNSGQDIRFVDADGTTLLSHQIELWNEAATSDVWAKVPQINASSATDYIWMYYDNAGAPDGQAATSVWDSSHQAVWHLNETSGTTNADSTTNARTGTKKAAGEPNPATAGQVAGADTFDGVDDYVNAGTSIALDGTQQFTASAWIYPTATPASWGQIMSTYDAGTAGEWWFALDSNRNLSFLRECGGYGTTSTSLIALNTWTQVTAVYDGALKLYINGVLDKNVTDTCSITNSGADTMIGAGDDGANSDRNFPGHIDEARISTAARSADWIRAEHVTSSNAMNTFGAEQAQMAWIYHNNATPADGAAVTSGLLSSSNVLESYSEGSPTPLNPNAIAAGSFGEWDYSVSPTYATPNTVYYFRMVTSTGTPLDAYSTYPSIVISPTFNQEAYRWYANADSTDVGASLAADNTAATAPAQGTAFRLRTALHVGGVASAIGTPQFKLQYAQRSGACDTAFSGETYSDVASGSGAIRYYNNTTPADGAAATANTNDPATGHTKVMQTYEEANDVTSVAVVPAGQDGVFDFSLVDFSAPHGTSYCFRVIKNDGSPIDVYSAIPEITTLNSTPNAPAAITQARTNSDGIPKTTLYDWDASTQSWVPGNDSLTHETGIKRTGAGSLKVSSTDGQAFIDDAQGGLRNMSTYGPTVSAWMYVPSSNVGANWSASISAQDPGYLYAACSSVALATDTWTLVTCQPDMSLLLNMRSFAISVQGTGTSGTTLFFIDDFQQGNGYWTNETSVVFSGTVSDPDATDTLALCVEARPVGTAFTGSPTCGTGVAYSGSGVTATVTIGSLTSGTAYHWRAQTQDAAAAVGAWTAYGGNSDVVTAATDFQIDTVAPTTGVIYDGNNAGVQQSFNTGSLSVLSGNWSGFGDALSGVAYYEYSIGTTAGGTSVLGWTQTSATSVTASSLVLQTSQPYFLNVRVRDLAGNISGTVSSSGQVVAPTLSFSAPTSVTFASLTPLNGYADTKSVALTTSTNGYGGYQLSTYTQSLPTSGSGSTVPAYASSWVAPSTWNVGSYGFGYTSDDTNVAGSNRFSGGTAYAGVPVGPSNAQIVADHAGPITGSTIANETFTITFKVAVDALQPAGRYTNTVNFSVVATY